jgi:hypothetical protein
MLSVYVIGGGIFLVLCINGDAKQTIHLVTVIITIQGITFLAKKVTETLNKDNSEIIKFAGMALSATSGVALIKLAIQGWRPVSNFLITFSNGLGGFAAWLERITFWN